VTASAGRKARVEQALRDTLSELIAREVKDPRVKAAGLLSVSRVECNPDLSVANVYISVYGAPDAVADKAIEGLSRSAGFLRGPTGRALHLAHPPELRFQKDVGPAMAQRLAEILREDEVKARAAGRTPGQGVDDDSTSEREPTRVLDDEPTADLRPAPAAHDDGDGDERGEDEP
jgi:ribosome-binding factor A